MAKKIILEKEEILWKDRRRRLGLPLSFTRYELSDGRLILRKGFFRSTTDEILIYRVMDISLRRSLIQKLFGVGTITLTSTDRTHPILELKSISDPDRIRRFLSQQIEQHREKQGIVSNEFLSAPPMGKKNAR